MALPIVLYASLASLLGCGPGAAPSNGVVEAVNLNRSSDHVPPSPFCP